MTEQQRPWLIVVVMWLCATFIHGTGSVMGSVFFAPLLKHFGGSRTRIAMLMTVNIATAAVLLPFSGWLLDMFEARWIICGGALVTTLGFIVASHATAYSTLVFANFLMGGWHRMRRSDCGFGRHLVLVVLATATTRRDGALNSSRTDSSSVAGLELREALRGHTFWLLLVANFISYMLASSTYVHEISFLTGLGYSPVHATLALTAQWTVAGFGKPMSGAIADRVEVPSHARRGVVGMRLVNSVPAESDPSRRRWPIRAVLWFGIGTPVTLMPLLIAECFGLKRFGTLSCSRLGDRAGVYDLVPAPASAAPRA